MKEILKRIFVGYFSANINQPGDEVEKKEGGGDVEQLMYFCC